MSPFSGLPLLAVFLVLLSGSGSARAEKFYRSSRAIRTFRARDCGGSNAAVRFRRLSVTPSPIALPGAMHVGFTMDILRNVSGSLINEISIARSMDLGWLGKFWVDIPLFCPIGQSCGTDICAYIARHVQRRGCPSEITDNGYDCTCPPRPGTYSTRDDLPLVVNIGENDLPHAMLRDLMTGTYRLRSVLSSSNGEHAGCFQAEFGLQHIA